MQAPTFEVMVRRPGTSYYGVAPAVKLWGDYAMFQSPFGSWKIYLHNDIIQECFDQEITKMWFE